MSEQDPWDIDEDRDEAVGRRTPQVAMGIAFTIGVTLLVIALSMLVQFTFEPRNNPFLVIIALIGVSQLLYVIPMFTLCWLNNRRSMAGGVVIGACIVFLLNAACFGLVTYTLAGW